ncbi:MAG TPA: hypothetical protein VE172_08070 [Stackebrandtia sp.]|uniref:hypothetical protein n=1 Tax=Stackebrandtia sp. TaxID=2023065 RepID=UPI002D25F688|nr:hypothetical protein [Stackebrandtia sp.]HZE38754.1 hypothetical protein [Stackebrandtia sp.]
MRNVILAAAMLTLAAGCGSATKAAAPPPPTPTPAATPTYDGSTMDACKEAAKATDPKDKKYVHAQAARAFAALSDVAALRGVAKKFSDAPAGTTLDDVRALTAAITVDTWCIQHHVKA